MNNNESAVTALPVDPVTAEHPAPIIPAQGPNRSASLARGLRWSDLIAEMDGEQDLRSAA